LVILAVTMGNWKIYQCRFTVPDQIEVYGHVKGNDNSYVNDHWVLLYEGNVEIKNNITHRGRFTRNKRDKEEDGYFEFEISNTELTRCSLTTDFKQSSTGHNFLWFKNKTTYIWHDFNDLRLGENFRITLDGQKKNYNLVVLPRNAAEYPNEINIYRTYLKPDGEAAVNIPIKTYPINGDYTIETITGYYVAAHSSSTAPQEIGFPAPKAIRDAWVKDDSANPIQTVIDPRIAGEEIVDIPNCTGSSLINRTEQRTKVYIHEVQFLGSPSMIYDLGQIAYKAADSLGFMQGKIDVAEAFVNVYVPVGEHMKYKIVWHDVWKPGEMRVDVGPTNGPSNIPLQFRAKVDMTSDSQPYSVDCP